MPTTDEASERLVDKANGLLDTALDELNDMIQAGSEDTKLTAMRALMPMLRERMQGEEESEVITRLRETQAEFFAEVRDYLISDHLVIDNLPADGPPVVAVPEEDGTTE